ncbi:MAG: calcium/sodium antiporter [Nitrospinaceae bacterium]
MITDFIYVLAGLASLYFGGETLITGSLRIAHRFKISPFVIGATVMGFGTSSPELAVSVLASFQGAAEVAVGNVIGSNIANVGLVLGLTALIVPLTIDQRRFKSEAFPLLIASFLILFLAWDFSLSRWEGLLLLAGLLIYIWKTLKNDEASDFELGEESPLFAGKGMGYQIVLTLAGLALLILGADWMVHGAVHIAREVGISEWLIGISIVALGTSLPEIVSSLLSARRGHGEMALGNIFGSNIFNIFMVLGASASLQPLNIQEAIHPDLLITTGLTCLLLILIRLEHQLSKHDGIILLLCYFSYIGLKGMGTI